MMISVKQVIESKVAEVSFWGSCLAFEDAEGNEINLTLTDEIVHQLAKRFATKSTELRAEHAEAARIELESQVEDII